MNKIPTKIQSQSLLIESGVDWQQKCQVFQFNVLALILFYKVLWVHCNSKCFNGKAKETEFVFLP